MLQIIIATNNLGQIHSLKKEMTSTSDNEMTEEQLVEKHNTNKSPITNKYEESTQNTCTNTDEHVADFCDENTELKTTLEASHETDSDNQMVGIDEVQERDQEEEPNVNKEVVITLNAETTDTK